MHIHMCKTRFWDRKMPTDSDPQRSYETPVSVGDITLGKTGTN